MKNFSKKNFTGKNNKDYKKNSDFGYQRKNKNLSEKNERFLNNSAKKMKVENSNKKDKNNTFLFEFSTFIFLAELFKR